MDELTIIIITMVTRIKELNVSTEVEQRTALKATVNTTIKYMTHNDKY